MLRAAAALPSIGLLLWLCPGCDQPAPRAAVQGTVLLDGSPLQYGFVEFQPELENEGPAVMAEIHNGRFSLQKEAGPGAGAVRVRLHGRARPPVELDDPRAVAAMDDETAASLDAELLPERYHMRSEIVEHLHEDRLNELSYQLTSD
jgi:hypothetical protein